MLAVAPMLDWTDRHCRYFLRQISQNAILYSEMIVADSIIHGNQTQLLSYDIAELPLIAQLAGCDRQKLSTASKICAKFGYSAINLNVGCPSDRVSAGKFGACLMQNPPLVADCIKAMQDAVTIPVTVKHRLGLGYNSDYNLLSDFVATVSTSGCQHFIVHARNAILTGLSPKQNREVPPLNYDFVYRLCADFPNLQFTLNGGINTVEQIQTHLPLVDGVMLGRAAYYHPYLLAEIESEIFNNSKVKTRYEIALATLPYLENMHKQQVPLYYLTRHMTGLFHGQVNAKQWRIAMTNSIMRTKNALAYYEQLLKLINHA